MQFRAAESFDHDKYWLAVSAEEPQGVFYTGPNGLAPTSTGTINVANAGVSTFASTVNYSDDIAPDVIVKAAADPGWGHYELYGLLRFLHDRVSTTGSGRNNTVLAGGGGAGMVLPIIPKVLDFPGERARRRRHRPLRLGAAARRGGRGGRRARSAARGRGAGRA